MKACPRCKSKSNHKMKSRGIIKVLPGFTTYACDNCNQYYTWNSLFNFTLNIKY